MARVLLVSADTCHDTCIPTQYYQRIKGIQKITVADLVNTEFCTVKRNKILFIKRFANQGKYSVLLSTLRSVQFSSATQSCPTLCDPMNRSTPGLPVHHHLPEITQTRVHRVSDAIQPSHPRSSPLLLPPIPPSIRVFSNESTLHMRCPRYWSFSFSIIPSKEIPGLISFRMDWLETMQIKTSMT